MSSRSILSLFTLLVFPYFIYGQSELISERFMFEKDLNYDLYIPTPSEYLGYELGEELTLYAHVEQYVQKVASLSDRVNIKEYGETYEGRKLYSLVISSTSNMQNIENLRENNLKIMDPVNHPNFGTSENINSAPVVVSFSYNIHGNETSSTEAAMQVLYRLAAANDEETASILSNAVVVLYPCINPDGRDRYVYWYKGSKRAVLGKEPKDMEHYAPFPNGRTNHYWFDLNRDWIWGVHPESRGHTTEYLSWMPQLHTDYHEMGYNSNYFTMPGTTPRNKLLPDDYERLSDTIGQANIEAFNEYKVNYYTRESFDFFYPGYGSSYPSVMGAIAMLVEQGGISGGRAVETNDGFVLTLRQRLYDHYRTSMATLGKAVDQKTMFLNYSRNANDPANSKNNTSAYIVKNNGSPYLQDFQKIMTHHGIEFQVLKSDMRKNARSYRTGNTSNQEFSKGDFIVSTNQSKHLFIHSIMARNLEIEDSVMYDMSSWALPIAYNLEAYEVTEAFNSNDLIDVSQASENAIPGISKETYALTIDWNQRNAPKALSLLWNKGYKVRVASESFTKDDKEYLPGTLVILVGRNLSLIDNFNSDVKELMATTGISIESHNTGRMDEGLDLASNKVRPIHKPKVGMLVGPPFNTYTAGQIYFLFDQETAFPIERIRTEVLQQTAFPKFGQRYGQANLFDYDVIILPGGGGGLKQLLGEEQQKVWKEWIQLGGKVIATESAAEFFTKKNSKFTSVELIAEKKDSSVEASTLKYSERETYNGHKRVPGSALNSIADTSNPLAFGLSTDLYTLKFGNKSIKPSPELQSVVRYSDSEEDLLVAGYASEKNISLLAGNASAAYLPMGSGGIVFLLDNTQYRMFWRGPSRMMQNAVMLMSN